MSQIEKVKAIINFIKMKRNNWQVSQRTKNFQTAISLGVDSDAMLDDIYDEINWHDYVEGPLEDDHTPQIPGPIWIFGLIIEGAECYLKFQIKNDNIIFWISIHPAEYPLHYPFK